jgi:hypothetical protein
VDAELDRLEASIPVCTTGSTAPTARVVPAELSRLTALARRLPGLTRATMTGRTGPGQPVLNVTGPCGGELQVDWEHGHGDTDYVATFAAYCADSDAGPIVIDGVFEAHERGNPTDSGPMIKALEMETDGPIAMSVAGQVSELRLDGAVVDYGVPSTWTPGVPTADDPDVVRVREASITYPDGTVGYAEDVRIERVGASPAVVTILEGVAGIQGEGRVDVSTLDGDPLIVDFSSVSITGGTVVLDGRGGSQVTITPGSTAGTWEVAIDGQPHGRAADCSDARAPIVQVGLGLLAELPIY